MSQATLGAAPYHNSSLFSGYYLDERIADLDEWDCDEAARVAFEDLRELWELEADLVDSYNEDELLDSWIDEVVDVLGFGTLSEATLPDGGGFNDRLLFESDETRRDAAKRKRDGDTDAMYGLASAVLEAKQWDADFTERFNEQRSYRDASHQIKYYLEHTPERLKWGILTDGKKWRLYGTKDYATEIYYEVDLPELLKAGDVEAFKYFYAFFRPAAFREVAGTSFLDTVWNESETAAQELGEDLQDNVFTALRVLGEGFIETNDLDIDPDDAAAREELKEQSLVLLYRLMFVLYAESRGLIHPDDPAARDEFAEHFSLDEIRLDIHERVASGDEYDDYSGYATKIWGQLQDLFGLVDEGNESLGIPPYNGGLFDAESHRFLAENEVADRYIAEVIHRLGTTEGEDGTPVLADYADLDTRHLGSIYEGLLEHEFRIAPEPYAAVAEDGGQVWKPGTEVSVAEAVETVEAGELYVVNDDGERKATGAYYTPDYVVSYIVEETVDPLLADIKADLEADGLEPSDTEYFRRFWQGVLDLKVLDPAMGSAHFLTSATGYLTEQVMEVVREQEIQSYDEQELRRTIAKECIYGVDVNGMAVELGKLSMWLETLAADKPLAFLDHHLKTGNSLVGSDISEVLSDDTEENGGQLTLTQAFARARQQTLEHVMELMADLLAIDNDDLDDIKSMEEIYAEIRADPLYQRLFEIANVHTAEEFGLDVPEGVYEEMAGAIESESEWAEIRDRDWFRSAQAMADDEDFFHWELEFPEVFFGMDGERLDGAGFDAVVGNPPWLNAWEMSEKMPDLRTNIKKLFSDHPSLSGHWDYYIPFCIKALDLCKPAGVQSFILPNTFLSEKYATNLRKEIIQNQSLRSILDFGEQSIFRGVERQCVVYVAEVGTAGTNTHVIRHAKTNPFTVSEVSTLQTNIWEQTYNHQIRTDEKFVEVALPLVEKVFETTDQLGEFLYVNVGATVSSQESGKFKKDDVVGKEQIGNAKRFFQGSDLSKWYIDWGGEWLDYRHNEMSGPRSPELFESEKIAIRKRTDKSGRLAAAHDSEGLYCDDTVIVCCQYNVLENTSATTEFDGFKRKDQNIDLKYVVALVNSNLMTWIFKNRFETGALQGSYSDVWPQSVRSFPIPRTEITDKSIDSVGVSLEARKEIQSNSTIEEILIEFVNEIENHRERFNHLNLELKDHLGSYSDGHTLSEIGLTQPPKGSADSVLQETTEQKPNLRVGEASVVRESDTTVEIRLTARYKPDDEDSETRPEGGSRTGTGEARGSAHETDQWGYTETDPLPALRITDLSAAEADLIEAFVPVAVDEAGGFAGFRETATKTNSLVDRLRKLTLPAVDDVREGLASYVQTMERADELEAKIERTDDLIDEIVYELYGLTDEEIEIVEDAVGE